jgi:hypothetical protein
VNRSKSQRSTETGTTLEDQYKESKKIVNDDSFWEQLDGVSVELWLLHHGVEFMVSVAAAIFS